MNVVIVDDNFEFAKKLGERFEPKPFIVESELLSLSDICVEIKKRIETHNEALIFININLKTIDSKQRQDQKGIDLLKYLRLRDGVMDHCVLYSFESVHELLKRNPENLILCSKGCTYIQLPDSFDLNYSMLLEMRGEQQEIRRLAKLSFNIEQFRHSFANLWGVRSLWEVHRVVDAHNYKACKWEELPGYKPIFDALSDLSGIMAMYIYGFSDIEIERSLVSNEIERFEEDINLKIKENNRDQTIINGLGIRKIKEAELSDSTREAIEHNVNEIKENTIIIHKLKNKIIIKNELLERIKDCREVHDNFISDSKIGKLRELLHSRKPRILYIDDKADEGWADIFILMIYGELNNETKDQFITDNLKSSARDIDRYYDDKIKGLINSELTPEVILLDLRLFNEGGSGLNISELSGVKLLEKIRVDFKGIPVIITTASNKVVSFDEMMKLGADGYWIKEGIDEQRTGQQTVRNYERFLELIVTATSWEYKILKFFSDSLQKMKNTSAPNDEKRPNDLKEDQKYWWENHTWPNSASKVDTTTAKKSKVIYTLEYSLIMYRNYLCQFEMGYGFQYIEHKSFAICGIINKLVGVVEEVHFSGSEDFNSNKVGGKWSLNNETRVWGWTNMHRQDWIGQILLNYRNKASHNYASIGCKIEYLNEIILLLLYWLQMKEYEQFNCPVSINNKRWDAISRCLNDFLMQNNICINNF
jgi:CheY-like chemotaxis protein